ncbi:putative sh3 and ded_cyto domain [Phaeomoniella chlamydospora]|uniref:Putative sh3 and ded_cyto domain n=1 Tax=Phaeomoniella chlamydospora TaxID=158046 RepID=A0A0G2EMB7_PHACM|nr:putative sh3 and ded_cyto domain [Phaeomoniella chlamydospora]
MPWRPLPRIAFAVAIFPFQPTHPADLPLELGDELYIIEQGGKDGAWYRGYLVAPPSLLSGLTSVKGQTLEARVFSGIFPKNCVEVRELLAGPDAGSNLVKKLTNGTHLGQNGSTDGASRPDKNLVDKSPTASLATRDSRRQKGQKDDEDLTPSSVRTTFQITPLDVPPREPGQPKPPAPVPMLKVGDETPTSASEPLVDEIASCLREWHSTNLHELLLARQYGTLEKMSSIVNQLDLARRQLLHDVLTAQERSAVRDRAIWNLVKGNKMLGGEVIVRDQTRRGRLVTGDDSAVEMTKLQSIMSVLGSNPLSQSEPASLHHLLCEVKAVTGLSASSTTLSASLYLGSESGTLSPLSEAFHIELPANESFANLARSSKLKTIFTDLGASDIGEKSAPATRKVYLVVNVQAFQTPRPRPSSPGSSASPSREGTPTTRSSTALNPSGRGSVKAGRRSLMFGPKGKTAINGDRPSVSQGGRSTPIERAPSSDRLRTAVANGQEQTVSRTVGVGVLEVGHLLRQEKDVDFTLNVWSAAGPNDEDSEELSPAETCIPQLLRSLTGRYVRSPRASRIHLHLSPHAAPDAETLIKKNPTSMYAITRTRKIGFSEAPTQERSDIYLTLSEALIPRGALLSHPDYGQVPLARSTNLFNLQLTMEVRSSSGKRIENCIVPASNSVGHTAWRTNVAAQGSRWNQTICLKIPPEEVPGSHLIMSLANAPEFPFALCWMPLWHDNAFVRDGRHTLVMHAYDKSTSSMVNGRGAYLSLPWNSSRQTRINKDESVTGPAASLIVETYLCSTKYSQDPVILSLINWKTRTSPQLLESLKKLVFVPEIEIVKQLRDVFDALFAILVQKNGEKEYEDLVFNDLVTVLGIVHDRRFKLVPLVDQYAETQFNYPFATSCLMKSFNRLLNDASDPATSRLLRATIKVGQQIVKFIMRARTLQKLKEEEIGVTKVQSTFNSDMYSVFAALEAMMRNDAPALIGNKTLIVQHFHGWLPELLVGFSRKEVIQIAIRFIDAANDVKGKLILYKLVLILNLTQLEDVFVTREDRELLTSHCLKWLAPYWGDSGQSNDQWRDQVRLCSSIVAELSRHPVDSIFSFMPKIVSSYCNIQLRGTSEKNTLSLLFPKSFPFQSRTGSVKQNFDEALLELATLMAALLQLGAPPSFALSENELTPYILSNLEAHRSILSSEAYPSTWLSLHVYHHRSAMKALEHISQLLTEHFLPSPDLAEQFDMEIWKAFFGTLLKLVSSNALALETFAEQKRRAVWKVAGDVRENGADLLRRTWEAIGWESSTDERRRYGLRRLGGYQVQYVPGLIPQIMELSLSVHEGLRRVAVEVLQTMIVSEWALSEDLSLIETEMIASLDLIFKTKKINESVTQKLFIGELLSLFETIETMPDDALWIAIKELVATIDELMDLLVNAHGGPMTESVHTMRLMEFMKDMQKEDIFVRYVHELAEREEQARNPTEAGIALRAHAELYDWDSDKTVAAIEKPFYPEQPAFDRKESLYFQMIQLFEDGKSWNNALASYRELADQYEHVAFDYAKLARTQKAMGKIHESIAKDDRHTLKYFRVTYLGLGFPSSLREKEYIFEGLPSERMATFTDRLQKLYPAAQIVSNKDLEDLEGQYLLVSNVSPHRELEHPVLQRGRVPQAVRDFLLTSNPIQFTMTLQRQTAGSDVKEHWVEKSIFTTAEAFPTILKRSEIVSVDMVRLSPLQTAIERVWRKTGDLGLLEKRGISSEDQNLSALTETLNQLLDTSPNSQACMATYRQLIKAPEKGPSPVNDDGDADINDDEMPEPPRDPTENALLVALADHAATIKRCLSLYTRPSLQATRVELVSRFEGIYPDDVRLKTPSSSHRPRPPFSAGSSPPRVSMDPGGKIAIEPQEDRQSPSIGRALSPEPPSISGRPSHDKHSRMSLHFLKGATNAMFAGDRTSKDMSHMQPRSTNNRPTTNGFHATDVDSSAAVIPHDAFSNSTNAHDRLGLSSRATSASDRSRSKSRNRMSFFGAMGDGDQTNGLETHTISGLASLRGGGDANINGSADDQRPLTSDSSHGDGSQSSRAIKKRFSLLKLGKKKSEGSVRISEVLEES